MENIKLFSNLEVDPVTLPKVQDLEYQPLESKFIYMLLIETVLGWFTLIGFIWFLYYVVEQTRFLPWVIVLTILMSLAFLLNLTFLKKACRERGYAVREKDITYKRGVIRTRHITIPYNRIQQVVVSQNLILRTVGLYSLNIRTAAQSSDGMEVAGLKRERAQQLKQMILDKIN